MRITEVILGNQLQEGMTFYYFDNIGKGGKTFDRQKLVDMRLRQDHRGNWYYAPSKKSTPLDIQLKVATLEKILNVPSRAWTPSKK